MRYIYSTILIILITIPHDNYAQKGKLIEAIITTLPTSCIELSPDKEIIAVADDTEDPLGFKELKESFKIMIFSSNDYSKKIELLGHEESIESISFSGDSKRLVSADKSGTIIIWDIEKGKQITRIETGEWVHKAKFTSSASEIVAIQGYEKKALIYDIKGLLIATINVEKQINDFDMKANSNEIYFGCYDEIQIWSLISRKKLNSLRFAGLMRMKFNHKFSQIAIGTSNGDVILMDSDLKEIRRFKGHFKPVLSISFNFDDTKLASASSDQTARIWSLNNENQILQLTNEHKGTVQAIQWISDRNEFITGGVNKELKIWK